MTILCLAAVFMNVANQCAPPITEMPALMTVYDTALCESGESCVQGSGDGYFASMIEVSDEWYGRMAACHPELFGETIFVMGMQLYCGDSFGTWNGQPVETVVYDWETDTWHIRVDVYWPVHDQGYPEWNYYLTEWEMI